jgi:Anti-sigma-K factor rskA
LEEIDRNTSFDLTPTDLLPGATGKVKMRRNDTGTRIDLNVKGLPLLPDGGYYQAWVKGPKGLVAIGTFSKEGKVVLWSGVALREYNTITITVEPDDGDAASSGNRVFDAQIPAE